MLANAMLVEDGPHAGCRFPSHLSLTAWLLTVRIPTLRTADPDAGYHSPRRWGL
ncbi:hypothetical protein PC128_g27189 [Phytophthora cactorum]|nr:hypothetical protein PC128_g27189 [Phytophthora cactorum]